MHYGQLGLILQMQGLFNICISVNVIYYINRMKDESILIISIDAEKAFDKIQKLFMIKSLNNAGTQKMNLNIIRAICDKPMVYIHNDDKIKIFSVISKEKQDTHHFYST